MDYVLLSYNFSLNKSVTDGDVFIPVDFFIIGTTVEVIDRFGLLFYILFLVLIIF